MIAVEVSRHLFALQLVNGSTWVFSQHSGPQVQVDDLLLGYVDTTGFRLFACGGGFCRAYREAGPFGRETVLSPGYFMQSLHCGTSGIEGKNMSTDSYFHDDSGTVRFRVNLDQRRIGAMVRKETLHYRFHPYMTNDDPLATYRDNAAEIDDAVRRRAAAGSAEPILVRDADLASRRGTAY